MFKKKERQASTPDANASLVSFHSQQSAATPPPQSSASPPAASRRTSFFGMGSKDKSSNAGKDGGLFGRTMSRMSLAEGDALGSRPSVDHARGGSAKDVYEGSAVSHNSRLEGSRAGAPSSVGHTPSPQPLDGGQAPAASTHDQRRLLQDRQQSQLDQHNSQLAQGRQQQGQQTPPQAREPHPEIAFFLDLIALQPNKVYGTSPPTLKFMVAAGPDGKQPRNGPPGTPGNDWQEVWVELRGIILHVWNMKEVAEANARGEDKHPTRTNVTDAFVDLIQPLPPTKHDPASGPHPFVFSINTAGLNSLLFSCPSKDIMMQWVTSIRLAGWESSRLMELYTGHLLRAVGIPSSPLVQGRYAGWFDVRTFGNRQWLHLWVILSVEMPPSADAPDLNLSSKSKKRLSKLFGGSSGPDESLTTPYPMPIPGETSPTGRHNAPYISAQFFKTPPNNRSSKASPQPQMPFLTITDVTQAFAVFPEVEAEVENSAMLKLEGKLMGEGLGSARRDEGWTLMIPVEQQGEGFVPGKRADMLRWLVAFHDAFGLYGRPREYSWNARDPQSLFFAHPHGESAGDLFVVDPASNSDELSISRASFVRSRFRDILIRRIGGQPSALPAVGAAPIITPPPKQLSTVAESPTSTIANANGSSNAQHAQVPPVNQRPILPPIDTGNGPPARAAPPLAMDRHSEDTSNSNQQVSPVQKRSSSFQLPPLSFGGEDQRAARPIQEPPARSPLPTPQPAPILSSPPPAASYPGPSSSVNAGATSDHRVASDAGLGRERAVRDLSPGSLVQSPVSYHSPAADFRSSPSSFAIRDVAPAPQPLSSGSTARAAPTQGSSFYSNSSAPYTPPSRSEATEVESGGVSSSQPASTPASPPTSSAPLSPYDSRRGSPSQFDPHPTPSHFKETSPTPEPSSGTEAGGSGPITAASSSSNARHSRYEGNDPQGVADAHAPVVPLGVELDVKAESPVPHLESHEQPPSEAALHSDRSSHSGHSTSKRELVNLGRRPSGARAAPARRVVSDSVSPMPLVSDEDEVASSPVNSSRVRSPPVSAHASRQAPSGSDHHPDVHADALAAMSFLDSTGPPSPEADPFPQKRALPAQPQTAGAAQPRSLPPIQTRLPPSSSAPSVGSYPSSFGPSKTAQERRAKAEAAQQQRQDVLTKPGKGKGVASSNGKTRKPGWDASSDEDEEENDDDDEGSVDSGPRRTPASSQQQHAVEPQAARGSVGHGRPLPNHPSMQRLDQQQYRGHSDEFAPPRPAYAEHGRPSSTNGSEFNNRSSSYSSFDSHVHQPVPRRPSTMFDERGEAPAAARAPARGSVWTTHLENPHGGKADGEDASSKFVSLEPNPTLTKAFNPHGLLQAGLEDRNDRSAKRQEEVARETGNSLVNVPTKAPPPQAGLLGAVTAHERERARDGGVGAALTERERDRRLAEERARKIDALQREQLEDLARQGYPQAPMGQMGMGYGYNSYMMSGGGYGMPPQGMMPPMGGYGGYGMDPQMAAMMAAQQVYQQTMMHYSQAGSQMGGGNGVDGSVAASAYIASPNPHASPAGGPQQTWPSNMMPWMMGGGGPGSVAGGYPQPQWGSAPMPSPGSYLPPQFFPQSQAGSVHGGRSELGGPGGFMAGPGSPDELARSRASFSSSPLAKGTGQQGGSNQSRSSTPRSASKANVNGN